MSISFPTPKNFPYNTVFYFDDEIALMMGNYKENEKKSLGMRWIEAESPLGYPNAFGRGMWMVVSDNLALYILEGINKNLNSEKDSIKDMDEFEKALDYFCHLQS